jgi:ATP-binding cassette subfamily F protein 3
VQADYFAQDQYKELNPDARILDDLGEISARSTETELRSLLGCFLFSAEDVFKRIGVLSGGERNRYALLRMLLHPANFLLLDEPTNHLDMRAKDVLLESLSKYTGTVLFVSHDRYFIDKLATRIFEVGDGRVDVYPGNYEDYLWRKQGGAAALEQSVAASAKAQAAKSEPAKSGSAAALPTNGQPPGGGEENADDKRKRLNPLKRRQIEERVKELEIEISRLETAIVACETALQTFESATESGRQSRELNDSRARLKACLGEWEELGKTLQV